VFAPKNKAVKTEIKIELLEIKDKK